MKVSVNNRYTFHQFYYMAYISRRRHRLRELCHFLTTMLAIKKLILFNRALFYYCLCVYVYASKWSQQTYQSIGAHQARPTIRHAEEKSVLNLRSPPHTQTCQCSNIVKGIFPQHEQHFFSHKIIHILKLNTISREIECPEILQILHLISKINNNKKKLRLFLACEKLAVFFPFSFSWLFCFGERTGLEPRHPHSPNKTNSYNIFNITIIFFSCCLFVYLLPFSIVLVLCARCVLLLLK